MSHEGKGIFYGGIENPPSIACEAKGGGFTGFLQDGEVKFGLVRSRYMHTNQYIHLHRCVLQSRDCAPQSVILVHRSLDLSISILSPRLKTRAVDRVRT